MTAVKEIIINGELEEENQGPQPSEFTKQALEGWQAYVDHDQDIKIGVYRLGGRKEPNLFNFYSTDYTPDQIMEKVREEFGQGEYSLKAWGKGKKGLILHKQISIEEAREDPMKQLGNRLETMLAGQKPVENNNNDIIGMMMTIQQENSRMMMQAQQESSRLSSESAQRAQESQNTLLGLILPMMMKQPEKEKQPDILDMLVKLQGLTPKAPDPMDGFFKGVEMMKDLGGGAESNESDVFRDMFKAMSPLVEKVASEVKNSNNRANTVELPENARSLSQEQIARTPMSVKAIEPVQAAATVFTENIVKLLAFARANTDPVSVIDIINAMSPESELNDLEKFLNRQDWFAMLVSANPDVAKFEPWFTLVRDEFLSADQNVDDESKNELTPDERVLDDNTIESTAPPDGLPGAQSDMDAIETEANADQEDSLG